MQAVIEKKRREAHASGRALLVKFTASWCAPCKAIAPKVAAATAGPTAPVLLEIDVDKCTDDVRVSSVPTLRLYRVGSTAPLVHVGAGGIDAWLKAM